MQPTLDVNANARTAVHALAEVASTALAELTTSVLSDVAWVDPAAHESFHDRLHTLDTCVRAIAELTAH